ncbi:hypothetical protein TNIN_196851 [Trichonephila inaurata madagascariensis]|uniref:Uncharacterized protein n=1 Tax=Trichonephila inaurata madagascariensis TaxID=2747483 RepID=A0A8X7CR04_9ARAC|nr:hypothetical protein TNIN_196851 [Trichonephila inaurata madagascariensis]
MGTSAVAHWPQGKKKLRLFPPPKAIPSVASVFHLGENRSAGGVSEMQAFRFGKVLVQRSFQVCPAVELLTPNYIVHYSPMFFEYQNSSVCP